MILHLFVIICYEWFDQVDPPMADPGWAHRRLRLRRMQRGGAAFARSWARYPKSFAAVWMAGTWTFFKLFVAFPGKLVSRNFQVGIFNANLVIPWSCQIRVRRLYQNSQKGWNFPVAGEEKMFWYFDVLCFGWQLPNSRLKGNLGMPPTLFQVFGGWWNSSIHWHLSIFVILPVHCFEPLTWSLLTCRSLLWKWVS